MYESQREGRPHILWPGLLSGPEPRGVLAGVRVGENQDSRPQLSDMLGAQQDQVYEVASFT